MKITVCIAAKKLKAHLTGLCLFAFSVIQAQYSNSWIVYNQAYYKIPVAQTGIYRLTYNQLSGAGFPVNLNPQNIQLWHRGKQVAIRVWAANNTDGETDQVFDPTDYVEFYGQQNNGWQDADYYYNWAVTNPDVNLYNDTSAYFITWTSNATSYSRMNEPAYFKSYAGQNELDFHLETTKTVFKDQYNNCLADPGNETRFSWGEGSEGWMSNPIVYNGNITYTIPISNPSTVGNICGFSVRIANMFNNVVSKAQVTVTNPVTGYTATYTTPDIGSISTIEFSQAYGNTALVNNTSQVTLSVTQLNNTSLGIVNYQLYYPQSLASPITGSKMLYLPARPDTTYYLKVNYTGTPYSIFDLSDSYNPKVLPYSIASGNIYINLPVTSQDTILISGANDYLTPAFIKKAAMTPIDPSTTNYYILTNPAFFSGADQYTAYRSSQAGGLHKCHVLDINDVYNQFGYGETTPVAIRSLTRYLVSKSSPLPKFLLLIGQGLEADFSDNNLYYRFNPSIVTPDRNYIPNIGVPASDLLLTQINSHSSSVKQAFFSYIPTGRLDASSNSDITTYLSKVMANELPFDNRDPTNLWRKNMVFLSGGENDTQREQFLNYVTALGAIAEGQYLGAKVQFKSQGAPGISLSGANVNIVSQVNNGLSLIYSLGHTAPTLYDVNYGLATDALLGYNNAGRYPVQYVAGCQAGNSFVSINSVSVCDDWLFADQKGSILFIGNTGLAYDVAVYGFSNTFLSKLYSDTTLLGKSVAEILQAADTVYMGTYGLNTIYGPLGHQMIIFGDPAVKLFNPPLADFYTDNQYISLAGPNGSNVTASTDSFYVKVHVFNFGKYAYTDSIDIQITRTFSNGSQYMYPLRLRAPVGYDTTYSIAIGTSPAYPRYGNNSFQVCINPTHRITESDYTNNCGTLIYDIPLGGIICLLPQDYSIVNTTTVPFVAQATNLLSPARNYIYEIDTSYWYNSNAKITGQLSSSGTISFDANIFSNFAEQDSTVFYWRIKFKDIQPSDDTSWAKSSFIFIKNSPSGWSQSAFPQFFESTLSGVEMDTALRTWNFTSTSAKIQLAIGGINSQITTQQIIINGQPLTQSIFTQCPSGTPVNGLLCVTLSAATLSPYTTLTNQYYTCGYWPGINYFTTMSNPSQQSELYNYLESVTYGDYILLTNIGNASYSTWSSQLTTFLEGNGLQFLNTIKDGMAYIAIFKKGVGKQFEFMPDTSQANPTLAVLNKVVTLTSNTDRGGITSTFIGPATEWGTLYRKFAGLGVNKKWTISITGYNLSMQNPVTLYTGAVPDAFDLNTLPISAARYPFLNLTAHVTDSINYVPPQLKKWQVIYKGVPEGIYSFQGIDTASYRLNQVTLGQSVTWKFGFTNISSMNFADSLLLVRITLLNPGASQVRYDSLYIVAPAPGKITYFEYILNTRNLAGTNSFQVFVNPFKTPELNYVNNVFVLPSFTINSDQQNPILDVTFDGVRILDGDIVSPSPMILISVHDDNTYLQKTDTSGITILLKSPCTGNNNCQFQRVALSGKDVKLFPNTNGSGKYQVEYTPQGLQDGTYCLNVQASDASGNASGVKPYSVCFQVINESSITNFFPYPNPFSTRTQFVFTLTGSVIPNQIRIEIMTVSGKVVREILKDELGPLRIGNNITQFAWDGTDQFGDRLANGIYLYKVSVQNDGNGFTQRQTSADQYFSHNIGKMYILR